MNISSDSIAKDDSLNRRQFASEISKNIKSYLENSTESLVIGINGAWGSGKSTLLEMIKEELISYKVENLNLFEFNPWSYSGKKELHTAFLDEFAASLGSTKETIKNIILGISETLISIEDPFGLAKSTGNLGKKGFDSSIADKKKQLNTILKKNRIKILVTIDDIDRLTPTEVLDIFQLIKLNANFSNTIFLISFDKSIVKEAIKNSFNLDGDKYLEKIIQVDYSVPKILPEDMEAIFFSKMDSLIERHKLNMQRTDLNYIWLYKGFKDFFNNVRDLNRYFNAIEFRLPSIHKNVCVLDFLVLEAIRIFDYASYENIFTAFPHVKRFGENSRFKELLSEVESGPSSSLYQYIFQSKYDRNSKFQYRVSDTEFFDRYFSLSLPKKDLREEEVEHFLMISENRSEFLMSLIQGGKVSFLLRRLSVLDKSFSTEDISEILNSLLNVWNSYEQEFADNWRNFVDAIKNLIKLYGEEKKAFHTLIDKLIVSDSNFNPAKFMYSWLLLISLEKDVDIDRDLLRVRNIIESRKNDILRSFTHSLKDLSSQFFFYSRFNQFYYRTFVTSFAKYLPDIYLPLIKSVIEQKVEVIKLISIFVLRDSTTKNPFAFDADYIPLLLPEEVKTLLLNSLKSIDLDTLPDSDAETIRYFLSYFEETAQS